MDPLSRKNTPPFYRRRRFRWMGDPVVVPEKPPMVGSTLTTRSHLVFGAKGLLFRAFRMARGDPPER